MNQELLTLCTAAGNAAAILKTASTERKNAALAAMAAALRSSTPAILTANRADLEAARANGIRESLIDRLTLTEARLAAIADSLEEIIALPDPCGSGEVFTRPNGLVIRKVRVPLGVIGMIYEARPNVTVDAAALCLKTGNACVLRGGKEALATNIALANVLRDAVASVGLPADSVCLIKDPSRASSEALMTARGFIDLLIPRGSASLIQAVAQNATVPVIETGAGNCHIYVDATADIDMAVKVAMNAKMSRPSVCNAAETLLVHRDIAERFLPAFAAASADQPHTLELRGCERTRALIDASPADESDWATEYGDYILAVKVVDSLDEAIEHINRYNTGHSEAILTSDIAAANEFQARVDAAVVYVNASTRFTDGGEFGLGAEIGISTQKLHARGPMGASALTTCKFLVEGNGQVR